MKEPIELTLEDRTPEGIAKAESEIQDRSPSPSKGQEAEMLRPDLIKEFFEEYDDWGGDLDALRLNMSIGGHVGKVPYANPKDYANILLDAQHQRAWVERFTNLSYEVASKINTGILPEPSDEDVRQVFNVKLARLLLQLCNDAEPTGPFARSVCEVLMVLALEGANATKSNTSAGARVNIHKRGPRGMPNMGVDDADRSSEPIPPELLTKCLHWVVEVHKAVGFGKLPARIAEGTNMATLAVIPAGLTMMRSATSGFKLRLAVWLAGLVSVVLAYALSWWFLSALGLMIIADQWLKRSLRQSWEFLAALLLALDMLASDFAGWAQAYPGGAAHARQLLSISSDNSVWLSRYVPKNDPSVLTLLAPAE